MSRKRPGGEDLSSEEGFFLVDATMISYSNHGAMLTAHENSRLKLRGVTSLVQRWNRDQKLLIYRNLWDPII